MKYELSFWGSVPSHTKYFNSINDAKDEAYRIHRRLEDDDTRAAHPAIISSPRFEITIN